MLLTVEQAQQMALYDWLPNLDSLYELSPEVAHAFAEHRRDPQGWRRRAFEWQDTVYLSLSSLGSEELVDRQRRIAYETWRPPQEVISLVDCWQQSLDAMHISVVDGIWRGVRDWHGRELPLSTTNLLLGCSRLTYDKLRYLDIHTLSLNGLSAISPEVARELAHFPGALLLDGVADMTTEVAIALGQHNGRILSLNGISTLTPAAAKGLASHRGSIYLRGLRTLSGEVAATMSAHEGHLWVDDQKFSAEHGNFRQSDPTLVSWDEEQAGEQHVGSISFEQEKEDALPSWAKLAAVIDGRDQHNDLHEVGSKDARYSSRMPSREGGSGGRIHDRYRLIAELGTGGMGVTYRAWDTQTRVPVVVKMPKREVRRDRGVITRFAREIEAMRAVPHESIVPITDFGDDEGCPFVAMRFLPGGSLADYRRQDEAGSPIKNPPEMLHFWLPGVAAALDHIHSKGMLHRDIKPGNIFLDGFLKPFVGDFGIAKVVDAAGGLAKEQTLTATKMTLGTPEYMAPELFKPRAGVDARADQYALAVTVYEMLCGAKPFTGGKAHIIVEHSTLPAPNLEKRCPRLPRGVCEAVHRALAKKPEERFLTCSDFAMSVLWELKELPPEPDTVRLLCPACRNVLKLTRKAAGKSGKCPRCQSAIDVAVDLGSLWLESEEWGGGDLRSDDANLFYLTEKQDQSEKRGVQVLHVNRDETEKQLLNLDKVDIDALVPNVQLSEDTYIRLLDFLEKERVFAESVIPFHDLRSLTASLGSNGMRIILFGSASQADTFVDTTVVTRKPYSWDEKVLATVFPIFFLIGLGGVALVGLSAMGYLYHLLTELTKMISRTIAG